MKCQCPYEDTGENHNPHQPNECTQEATGFYIRNGDKIALCGDCVLTGDIECNEGDDDYV